MRKWRIMSILLLSVLVVLAACNSNETENTATNVNGNGNNENEAHTEGPDGNQEENEGDEADRAPEEVVLQFAYPWGEHDFNVHYKEPIEEALPHITLELSEANVADPEELEQLITAQEIPDIMLGSGAGQVVNLLDFELAYAMDDLFEQNNFDWSRVDPNLMQHVRNMSAEGLTYGIPIMRRANNVYYNQDIFDTFGVAYPEDHMTWDEIIDLSASVTGEEDGIEYRGFDINSPGIMLEQRNVTHVDPETHEVLYLDEPIYTRYLQKLERLWSIPGMLPDENPGDYLYSWGTNFHQDMNVAMVAHWDALQIAANSEQERGLNWDVTTIPVWEDLPDVGPFGDSYMLFATNQSDHPEAIYEVFDHILSDEYQEWSSRNLGRATVLTDQDIQQTLASEMEEISDKNLESIFALQPNTGLPAEELTMYRRYDPLYLGVREFAELEEDVNTFLRRMQEMAEHEIEEAKAQGIEY